jgi:SAM-dependent methyltransferase
MLIRAIRTWRAKAKLIGPQRAWSRYWYYARTLHFPEYSKENLGARPKLKPYEGLARIWHDYTSLFRYNYLAYVNYLAKENRLASWSALDLACGTGLLASRLSVCAREVVGIDASEPMLEQARARYSTSEAIRFVAGDFRDFHLDRSFDFVVCAFNSLNYVGNVAELRSVFSRVAEHLRPGGLFVFDALTEFGMKLLSGSYLHVKIDAMRFAMRFVYDPASRTEWTEVYLPSGTEAHSRSPIDPEDVVEASRESGLLLEDYFSSPFVSGGHYTGPVSFLVMRRAS